MKLVVDASVSLKWFMTERVDEQNVAEALLVGEQIAQRRFELFSPPHWIAEVISVLARLDPPAIDGALGILSDLNGATLRDLKTMRHAADLAVSLKAHLFDTLYHAVALETGAMLVTADDRYFAKARGEGSILMLQDFKAAP